MASLGKGFCNRKIHHHQSPFLPPISNHHKLTNFSQSSNSNGCSPRQKLPHLVAVTCIGGGENGGEANNNRERRTFLTLEEAGLVEISGLSTHERFLCRLTISSLNLLKVIAEQEGCSIEELNAGKVCDWFIKDKLKREQDIDSAVLQWDDSEFLI